MNSIQEIKGHKVFPHTYLRNVVFTMSYGKISRECYSSLAKFISSKFGFDVTEERLDNLSNRPLLFGAKDHSVEWGIKDDSLIISIDQQAYCSFETSLSPLVETAGAFLKVIGRNASELFLNKINLIPVTLSSYTELKDNAAQVFTDDVLCQWKGEVYQKNDDSLIYLSKDKGLDGQDIEIISGFISMGGIAEDQPSRYILDIVARYSGEVTPDKVLSLTSSMNDQIYRIFIRSVGDEIKESMEET